MKKNVITSILDFFAPNKCYFCGKLGDLACSNCLEKQNFEIWENIRKEPSHPSREFYLGNLEGTLAQILDDLKFGNCVENINILAEILSLALSKSDDFMKEKSRIVLVPAPTSPRHIRQRGFAHSEQISKILARELGVSNMEIIVRKSNSTQKGASAKVRKAQAVKSYAIEGLVKKDVIYVILDDVKTTGSTIDSISKLLFKSGAKQVWAVYLMRQKI